MAPPSQHLSWGELACHDGTPYPPEWRGTRLPVLAAVFEDLRKTLGGHPLRIGSAYRTPPWNRRNGGAAKSQHIEGRALDIYCPRGRGLSKAEFRRQVKQFALGDFRVGAVGWYHWGVHIDTRGNRCEDSPRLVYWNQTESGTRLHDSRRESTSTV